MRKYLLLLLLSTSFISADTTETLHFHISYTNQDRDTAESFASWGETLYQALKKEFNYEPKNRIQVEIAESQAALFGEVWNADGQSWRIAQTTSELISIVSPHNPGSYHTSDSINRAFLTQIAKIFIEIAPLAKKAPFWLKYGTMAVITDITCKDDLPSFTINFSFLPAKLPALAELDKVQPADFAAIGGASTARLFTYYIEEKFGHEKLFALVGDYQNFEDVLGISKEALYSQWIASLERDSLDK